jgi:DNA-binding GntR family transcriptional regulator
MQDGDLGKSEGRYRAHCIRYRFCLRKGMQETDTAPLPETADDPEAGRRRGRLHQEAAGKLREMILAGELPPGMRLREVQLCEQLGVSRTPIREAFRTLAAEGLVELLPNRSVVVAELKMPDIEHLYRVFGALEGLAGELACQRVTEAQVAEMGRLLSQMVDLHQKGDRARYMEINRQIHRMVIDIAANPVLTAAWAALLPRVERARALPNLDPNRWTAALLEHSKMFTALAARDGKLLSELARQHFLNGLPYNAGHPEDATPEPRPRRRPKA